jgi:hypothetical protein
MEDIMKKITGCVLAGLLVLSLPQFSFSQFQDESKIRITPGFHFEYFARKIIWDEKAYISDMKSTIIALNTKFELDWGFSFNALIGYAFTNFDSLVFRQLPFSVELDVGSTGGFLFGAELRKSLFDYNDFEMEIFGQIIHNIGSKKDWEISGLNVEGTVTGKPSWTRVSIGPFFKYNAFESFYPYLGLCYNGFWGTYKMDQTVQTLEGEEEKKIEGTGVFESKLGSIFDLGKGFTIKGELNIIPYSSEDIQGEKSSGINLGFMAIVAFSF